jgi:hypothetical protein
MTLKDLAIRSSTAYDQDLGTRLARTTRFLGAYFAVLALIFFASAGCGSSAATSPGEAKAISSAEQKFLAEYRHANVVAAAQCADKDGQKTYERCHLNAVEPQEAEAISRFSESIQVFLESGVGLECSDQLKEALSTMNSVPAFPGGTASVCLSESQK